MDCEPIYSSFGRKVFNKVFKSAFKLWKRTFLFFFGYSYFFSWNLSLILAKIGQKNSALFSTQQNTCAKEQFSTFSQRKCSFISLLWKGIFRTLRKASPKKKHSFSFFVSRGHFGTFYQRLRLLLDCELGGLSFGRTVLNSVFKSAFKVWKSVLVFFN